MNDVSIELRGLTKRFGGLVAVNDVSLTTRKRTIHALIGPNGSGKTTIINLIHGVYQPTSGDILFEGKNISNLKTHQIFRLGMGRTFQNIKLFGTLSVLDNMLIGADKLIEDRGIVKFLLSPRKYAKNEREIIEKAEAVLDSLGIYALKDEITSNLAYGRQKVVELGRALMADPTLILLDEPAAGLNTAERKEFVQILQKTFEQGVDLFLIEHNMDVVMNISHRITVLSFGSIIAEGTPKEVQKNPDVIKSYLGERYKAMRKDENDADGR